MKINYIVRSIFLIFLLLIFGGCASVDVGGYVVPGENLDPKATYIVLIEPDDARGAYKLIQQELERKNLAVEVVDKVSGRADRDVLVRYGAQWQWDITWYLLNVNIRFYHMNSELLIASAQSRRTSLARKNARSMIQEAINQVLM
ncbi:MAG: hypothetical protein KBT63_12480 [Porticoccaceae bacterium]|nr:hypothetical protein [Porticoccaceae bacterium]